MPSRDPDRPLIFARPWFPGLATRLVAPALMRAGLTQRAYGSRRWVEGRVDAPRDGWPQVNGDSRLVRGEMLPPPLRTPYEALGLVFSPAPSVERVAVLEAAWAWLARVPDVEEAVAELVWAIHLLESPGPGYDVSHSDPGLPSSIFLSVPLHEPQGPLRAAESMLHEAMHLQLTLLESGTALVRPTATRLRSPWRHELRPVAGLVHGVYVFSAIDAFLAELLAQEDIDPEASAFAAKRRREIAGELAEVADLAQHEDLTPFGRGIVGGLLEAVAQRRNDGAV